MNEQRLIDANTLVGADGLFATEEEARDFCDKYVPSDYYDTRAILK